MLKILFKPFIYSCDILHYVGMMGNDCAESLSGLSPMLLGLVPCDFCFSYVKPIWFLLCYVNSEDYVQVDAKGVI